jgi:hypothetical protein
MVTVLEAEALVTKISMPRVFRREIEAMYPRRDNSAATKYSPATPARTDGILWLEFFGDFATHKPSFAERPKLTRPAETPLAYQEAQ